jgi:hypothetical protein
MYVLLSPTGLAATNEEWVPFSYRDLHRVLSRCRRINEGGIGTDVAVFLDHYLRLIGSRLMPDAHIDDLCRRIWKNHRQALTLIFDRVASTGGEINSLLESRLLEQNRWKIVGRDNRWLVFTPDNWPPPFHADGSAGWAFPLKWMFQVQEKRNRCRFFLELQPYAEEKRKQILETLTREPKQFGLRTRLKRPTPTYTRIYSEIVATWKETDDPDVDAISTKALALFDRLYNQWAHIPEALEAIIPRIARPSSI